MIVTGIVATVAAVSVIVPAISAATSVTPLALASTPAVAPLAVAPLAAGIAGGGAGEIPAAVGAAGAFAVDVGAATTILFTLDQITQIQDFPGCREASIESCARVNLNFDAFDRTINIFGTPMERNFEMELNFNTKFFEVFKF